MSDVAMEAGSNVGSRAKSITGSSIGAIVGALTLEPLIDVLQTGCCANVVCSGSCVVC